MSEKDSSRKWRYVTEASESWVMWLVLLAIIVLFAGEPDIHSLLIEHLKTGLE